MDVMVKLLFALAVMAIGFTGSAFASDRSSQMMRERNVAPSVLADRIDRQCTRGGQIDSACKPSGSNATVADFATSIRAHHSGLFMDVTPEQVPSFLRSLEGRRLPPDLKMCLSGMRGNTVVTTCRGERLPHPEELGWYKGETLVLAGDCGNSVVPLYAKPMPEMEVVDRGFKPVVRERKDPFANRRRTVEGQCAFPDSRYFGVMVFEKKAAQHECAVSTMHPYGGRLGARDGGGNGGSYHDSNRFSRTCGTPLRAELKAGKISLSTTPHEFEVVVDNGTHEEVIFIGTVIGNTITASEEHKGLIHESGNLLYLDDQYKTGDLVVRYLDPDDLRTPTASGTGERVENIKRGCKVGAFYAIDADGTQKVAHSD